MFLLGTAAAGDWRVASAGGSAAQTQVSLPRSSPSFSPGAGTCHTVRRGQTLYSIARIYRISPEKVARVNELLDPSHIEVGRVLFIPGRDGRQVTPPPPRYRFSWPIRGPITSIFGPGGDREHHEGIDIDGVTGQVVRAAAAGKVVSAGTERGYGNLVILDNGDGYTTVYAHASRLLVGMDEWVEAGEPIAEVGTTGNARGAHLHFEVRRDGRPVDPLSLLEGPSRISMARTASASMVRAKTSSP